METTICQKCGGYGAVLFTNGLEKVLNEPCSGCGGIGHRGFRSSVKTTKQTRNKAMRLAIKAIEDAMRKERKWG